MGRKSGVLWMRGGSVISWPQRAFDRRRLAAANGTQIWRGEIEKMADSSESRSHPWVLVEFGFSHGSAAVDAG
jgi:hypothetical protein